MDKRLAFKWSKIAIRMAEDIFPALSLSYYISTGEFEPKPQDCGFLREYLYPTTAWGPWIEDYCP